MLPRANLPTVIRCLPQNDYLINRISLERRKQRGTCFVMIQDLTICGSCLDARYSHKTKMLKRKRNFVRSWMKSCRHPEVSHGRM